MPERPAKNFAVGGLIREQRRKRNMTLTELGSSAGVSAGYLSQLERMQAVPSLATLGNIARALDLPIEHFVAVPNASNGVTRLATRPRFNIGDTSITYEKLGYDHPLNDISSMILTVPVGFVSETVTHDGEEIIFILEGSLEQRIGDEQYVLNKGDSLHFRSGIAHSWANPFDKPAKLIWTGTMALFGDQNTPTAAE